MLADSSGVLGRGAERHVSSRGLYGHIVETLGREIVSGKMPAQSILFAEQLSERFEISRSVVRESVRTLNSMGLLESRPQVGNKVLPISNWDLLNPQIIRWRGLGPDAEKQQRELLELRLGLEPIAAHFAALRMTSESAERLMRAALLMRDAIQSKDAFAFFDADASFHRLLLEGSGNLLIAQFAEAIDAGLQVRTTLPSTELDAGSVQLHLELAEAMRDGDGARGVGLATRIIEHTLLEFG